MGYGAPPSFGAVSRPRMRAYVVSRLPSCCASAAAAAPAGVDSAADRRGSASADRAAQVATHSHTLGRWWGKERWRDVNRVRSCNFGLLSPSVPTLRISGVLPVSTTGRRGSTQEIG